MSKNATNLDLQNLVGLRYSDSFATKSLYGFEFAGKINGEFKRFVISTDCNFSVIGEALKDERDLLSLKILDLIESDLVSVTSSEDDKHYLITFVLEEGKGFIIWSEKKAVASHDEMIRMIDSIIDAVTLDESKEKPTSEHNTGDVVD